MPKSDTIEKIRTDTKDVFKPEEPAKYDVVFLNDDITPMEFVIFSNCIEPSLGIHFCIQSWSSLWKAPAETK